MSEIGLRSNGTDDLLHLHKGSFEGEITVDDEPVSNNDAGTLTYARVSLPDQFEIQQSGIPDAGNGVYTKQDIPIGSEFGPYEGKLLLKEDLPDDHDSQYTWEIVEDGKVVYCRDGKSESNGNWLRFINCARMELEQNLTAVQVDGEIYYRSYKVIPAGSELLVWYGEQFAGNLGIPASVQCSYYGFPCSFCEKAFTTDAYLKQHLQLCRTKQRFIRSGVLVEVEIVPVSNKTTPTHEEPPLNIFPASSSITVTDDVRELEQLMKGDSVGDICVCLYCGKECKNFCVLKAHLRVHTGETPFRCDYCGKCFSSPSIVTEHARTHTGEKPYTCVECGTPFASKSTLKKHETVHSERRPYVCEDCGRAFKRESHKNDHIEACHHRKPCICKQCGEGFSCKSKLKRHELVHSTKRQFVCSECGTAFELESQLIGHYETHKRHENCSCGECGGQPSCCFKVHGIQSREKHSATNAGLKQFVCRDCGKLYSTAGHLTEHRRMHSNERPFSCIKCGKQYVFKNSLKKHMLTHSTARPFICLECGKSYPLLYRLKEHQECHKKGGFTCEHCHKTVGSTRMLREHKRKHAKETAMNAVKG